MPHRAGPPSEPTSTRRYVGDKPSGGPRCPGSAQSIDIDITPDQWNEALHAADSTATGRRSARQHHKPLAQPPTPVHRFAARGPQALPVLLRLIPLLERARRAVLQHRAACATCRGAGARCATGRALEVRLGETEATCTIAREQAERQERSTARALTAPAARRAQWAKHNKSVADTDTRRTHLPTGDTPLGAPSVPLQPLRPQRRAS
ncbi:hypothetical protein ACFWIA_28795 [Streptomyces sp. NPDC127068]|uniref:hypothetical protein n=1 Tax=Streptomyces sp. NPDC127068 TaxID=3347127 RepID=UPI003656B233